MDVRQVETLFDVLDYNNSGTLDSEEFVEAGHRVAYSIGLHRVLLYGGIRF